MSSPTNPRHLDPRRLVFIDETWAKTNMTRLRGRSKRGARLAEKVPHGHWKTTTLVAAPGHGGMRCGMTLDGAVDGDHFVAFCQNILAPTQSRGGIVVMDNLSSHKVRGVLEAIESTGASVLNLPPYSPDLNPIENAFSKLEQLLRSASHRIQKALWIDIQRMFDAITAADAQGFYRHCGYTLQGE